MPLLVRAERVTIRPAERSDLNLLCLLISEHAEYERADAPLTGLAERLEALLFGERRRVHALIATCGAEVVGYATWSLEASTWQGTEYAHMDCLYLREGRRGDGIGRQLFERVASDAAVAEAKELQWQTPDWNEGATRFYRRLGASSQTKRRFTIRLVPLSE